MSLMPGVETPPMTIDDGRSGLFERPLLRTGEVDELHVVEGFVRDSLPRPAPAGSRARWQHGQVSARHTGLGRRSAPPLRYPAGINARGISVRLEAIDALETHFAETHQELAGANAARDELLGQLGFTNVIFFDDLPNKVSSADQDSIRGHVLSNGIDTNGRLIGFVYPAEHPGPDGTAVFVDEPLVDLSVNAPRCSPLAWPTRPSTPPCPRRCAPTWPKPRRPPRTVQAPGGLWPRAIGDPDGPATVANLAALEQLVIWPKLFRRVVPYLAAGFTNFDSFDRWLRDDPIHRDDALFLLTTQEHANMHDVIEASGQQIQLTVWPDEFIISPDPPPPGGTTTPAAIAGDVVIVAALPNPEGSDQGHETITVINTTGITVNLAGWSIHDAAGGTLELTGTLNAGAVTQVKASNQLALGNNGDTIILVDATGATIDQIAYKKNQVKSGRTICFGR